MKIARYPVNKFRKKLGFPQKIRVKKPEIQLKLYYCKNNERRYNNF